MTERFSESIFEDAALFWLENSGMSVEHGIEIAHGESVGKWIIGRDI